MLMKLTPVSKVVWRHQNFLVWLRGVALNLAVTLENVVPPFDDSPDPIVGTEVFKTVKEDSIDTL